MNRFVLRRHLRTWSVPLQLCMLIAAGLVSSCTVTRDSRRQTAQTYIHPGASWLDNRGLPIQAHGGGVIRYDSAWYWFGEYRATDVQPDCRYVGCYRSRDLVHWTFMDTIRFDPPEGFGKGWVLERPKVFVDRRNHAFVMYVHLDDQHYRRAEVGVARSSRIDSGYAWVSHFRPFGMESRDIGQFIDDDGTSYLIFENRPTHGFAIARLAADRLRPDKFICWLPKSLEGGALVHYHHRYYVIGSHLTGWDPNPDLYASARQLSGPWTPFRGLAPDSVKTYGSQSTYLLKLRGTRHTHVIFMGDIWKPDSLWDSRYIWMPLKIGHGSMQLPRPRPWSVDVKTGRIDVR